MSKEKKEKKNKNDKDGTPNGEMTEQKVKLFDVDAAFFESVSAVVSPKSRDVC